MLAAALGATSWTLTRTDALAEAEAAYRLARNPIDYAESLRLALQHLDRRPWSRSAARVAARGFTRLDRPDEAEPYWKRLGRLGRDDAILRADGLLRSNRRVAALEAFRAIHAEWPANADATRRLAAVSFMLRRFDQALSAARDLAQLPGFEPAGRQMAAMVYHEDDLPAASANERSTLLEIDPCLQVIPPQARSTFWRDFANDLLAAGRPSEARDRLIQAGGQTEEPRLGIILGTAHEQLGQFEEARVVWSKAAEDPEVRSAALRELGLLELLRPDGSAEKAWELLRESQALNADDPAMLYGLQQALTRLGRLEAAREVRDRRERLLILDPPNAKGMKSRQ